VGGEEVAQDRHKIRVVVDSLGHPLALLLLGSLLTYIIAPVVIDGINQRKLRQEARQEKAQEVWRHNTEFNIKLNALKTMLESYHNQNARLQLSPADLLEAQKEFRRDFTKRYLELDEMAFWWYSDLEREVNTLDFAPKDKLPKLNADLTSYGQNVNDSIALLKPLWKMLTSHDYHPNEDQTKADFERLTKDADAKLPGLFHRRSELITDVAGIITSDQ
jgi:hypothetical protein